MHGAVRHIFPLNDARDHDMRPNDWWFCWCDPRIRFMPGHLVVIHNACDDRPPAEAFPEFNEVVDND